LGRYSDGGAYCFACGYHEHGDGQTLSYNKPQRLVNYEGEIGPIRNRKLFEETCKKFNVRIDPGNAVRFPYYDDNKALVGYKERGREKTFKWVGSNTDHQLFGQQLFGSGKTIVITEGEMDALSVWQVRNNWPVCSVPNGAHGAAKDLKHQLKWLLGFDEIVLMLDQDEAGQKATAECAALFPADRVFIAPLGNYKDASEALVAGDGDAIRQAYFNRKAYMPQAIIDGKDLFDLVSAPLRGKDADYPYAGLNNLTSGLRLGELVVFTAGSGTGKSTLCGEIAMSLVDQGFSVGYIALEESVQRTALRLMTVKANKPLHLSNDIDAADLRSAFDNSVGSGRVYLRDGFGSVDPDVILNDIRFMVKAKGVQWIILDHLSILLSGNATNDERRMLDITMTKLRSFVEETKIGMILISHLRRTTNDKAHEDGADVSLGHLRGSNSIAQLSDIVCCIVRNISSGDSFSEMKVLKNRFNGQTGPAGTMVYDLNTGRLTESAKALTATTTGYDDF
jgi:twinkle protein